MDLSNAALGEQYYIYLKSNNAISGVKTSTQLLSTVIGLKFGSVLLGWKPIQHTPINCNTRSGIKSSQWNYVDNQQEYNTSAIVASTLLVDYKVTELRKNAPTSPIACGCTCKSCGQFSPYAEGPNSLDGKFICYGCKIDW